MAIFGPLQLCPGYWVTFLTNLNFIGKQVSGYSYLQIGYNNWATNIGLLIFGYICSFICPLNAMHYGRIITLALSCDWSENLMDDLLFRPSGSLHVSRSPTPEQE